VSKVLGLSAIPVAEIPVPKAASETAIRIRYRWDEHEAIPRDDEPVSQQTRAWWIPTLYHSRRTENLADALEASGEQTVLAADASPRDRRVCVYPDHWRTDEQRVATDPIVWPSRSADRVFAALKRGNSITVVPDTAIVDATAFVLHHVPRKWADFVTFLPRAWKKVRGVLGRV
jgi:hypothetical protein